MIDTKLIRVQKPTCAKLEAVRRSMEERSEQRVSYNGAVSRLVDEYISKHKMTVKTG
jgi:hypothetical protein